MRLLEADVPPVVIGLDFAGLGPPPQATSPASAVRPTAQAARFMWIVLQTRSFGAGLCKARNMINLDLKFGRNS